MLEHYKNVSWKTYSNSKSLQSQPLSLLEYLFRGDNMSTSISAIP